MSTSNTAVSNSADTTGLGGEAFAIETFGLTRRFGDLIAANRVTLHVPYGAIFGLFGPNGAGEPTIGLDPVARRSVWERLLELRGTFQMTVLITTHGMDEADELCDQLAIMHLGKVAAIGRPADLKAGIGPDATLDDVFVHYSGGTIQEEGNYRDVRATRRAVSRLG